MEFQGALIDGLLWLRVGLQLALLATLAHRRLLGRFPFFAAYLGVEVLAATASSVLLLGGSSNYSRYFYFYWTALGLAPVLRAGVIREVLLGVFARHEGLKSAVATGWRWTLAAVLLAAVLSVWLWPGAEYTRLMTALFVGARVLNGLQFGLMLILFVMAAALSLPWRNFSFGVAFGFGIYAAASLTGFTIHMMGLSISSVQQSWMEVGGYAVAVMVWMVFLWIREPVVVRELPPEFALERWNQELGRILNR